MAIDWNFWQHMQYVKLWQAAFLACNRNPDKESYRDIQSFGIDYDDVNRVLRLLKSNFGGGHFSTGIHCQGGGLLDDEVSLSEFAAWCLLVGYDIPAELSVLAKDAKQIEAETSSCSLQPLEPLTTDQRQSYNNRAAWTWVDAIYILQGYKPPYQLSTEELLGDFPDLMAFFTESIELGKIGIVRIREGEKTYIDSPENWETFWQGINKQAGAVEDDGKVKAAKNGKNTFDKRLDALKDWLISLNYDLGDEVIILPKHYTLEIVYTELGKKNNSLFANIELSSFDSHFWGKQKIVELMRGNKSAIL